MIIYSQNSTDNKGVCPGRTKQSTRIARRNSVQPEARASASSAVNAKRQRAPRQAGAAALLGSGTAPVSPIRSFGVAPPPTFVVSRFFGLNSYCGLRAHKRPVCSAYWARDPPSTEELRHLLPALLKVRERSMASGRERRGEEESESGCGSPWPTLLSLRRRRGGRGRSGHTRASRWHPRRLIVQPLSLPSVRAS